MHHGACGRSSECFGAGAALSLVHGCNRGAARSDHLASGQRAPHRRGRGHGVLCPALGRAFAARYTAQGLQARGNLRHRNGARPSVLKPDLLDKLKDRLCEPPPDGGLWTSPKVAAWMASELGLTRVAPQRGWEALKAIGWSVQKPRPRHPASATPEEREVFKKSWSRPSLRQEPSTRTRRLRSGPPMSTASG